MKQSPMWDQQNVCTGWGYMHQQASIQVSIALWKLTLKQKGETLFHHSKACSLQPMSQVNVPLGPTCGRMSIIM